MLSALICPRHGFILPRVLCELEAEESDGSVRPLDSDDESEDGTDFLNLDKFPVPDELPSEEEGGGEEGGEEGSEEGGEDSEKDVPLAQRKVARV